MNRKFSTIITILLIILFCFPITVSANNSGYGTLNGGKVFSAGKACSPDCAWNYSFYGIRISLYKYSQENGLTYYSSKDYCTAKDKDNCINRFDDSAYQASVDGKNAAMAGKLAYQNLPKYGLDPNNTFANDKSNWVLKEINVNIVDELREHPYISDDNSAYSKNCPNCMHNDIIEYFKLESEDKNEIFKKLKEVFSAEKLTINELGNVYITVEPTVYFNRAKPSVVHFYGTAYEFANLFSDGFWFGNSGNGVIYRILPTGIMSTTSSGIEDSNGLVGKLVYKVEDPSVISASVYGEGDTNNRKDNAFNTRSNDGFGIAVYWLGDYVPVEVTPTCTITESSDKTTYTLTVQNGTNIYYDIGNDVNSLDHEAKNDTYIADLKDRKIVGQMYNSNGVQVGETCELERDIPTCEATCSGKKNDDLLACAEDYCQKMSSSSSTKKSCIVNDCGYKDPGFSACESNPSETNGKNTECDDETTEKYKTCVKATTSNYFKTECSEENTIKYGNSLPVTLRRAEGFSYTPTLTGTKNCTMTFEKKKWEFDYAASFEEKERTALVGKLNSYNKDVTWMNENYSYKSNDANIQITVTNTNDHTVANPTTTKVLVADKTTNLLSEDVEVTLSDKKSINLYNSGEKTTKEGNQKVETKSSNKTIYKLPGTCINVGSGTLYDLGPSGNCNSTNDGPYYRYYTDFSIDEGIYNTVTTVTKNGSKFFDASLSVENNCYYTVLDESPVSCSIRISNCEALNPTVNLIINNEDDIPISYGLSFTDKYPINDLKELPIPYNKTFIGKIYGVVATKDGKILNTCEHELINTCTQEHNTCKALYAPTQEIEIAKYCRNYWPTDTANYTSANNCIISCTTPTDPNTCKALYKTTQHEEIRSYCNTNWSNDTAKYTSADDCYKSCTTPNTCKLLYEAEQSDEIRNYCRTNWSNDTAKYTSEDDCYNSCTDGTKTCTEIYKSTQYEEIRNYCSTNWSTDTAKYASEKDCYNSCTTDIEDSCKHNPEVDTSNRESVLQFCSDRTKRENSGYNLTDDDDANIAYCINDCYSGPPGGGGNKYLYRPISLLDPFPNNRDPGANWYGKEIFVTDDLLNPVLNSGAEPEYVIELTPKIMDSIKKQTNTYNEVEGRNAYLDYVHNDEDDREGRYISKFIHSNDEATGGFGLYFTKVLD